MSTAALDQALQWVLAGNTQAFRADFDAVTRMFPGLDADDLRVLRAIHEKGMHAPEFDEHAPAVEGQGSERSHGW